MAPEEYRQKVSLSNFNVFAVFCPFQINVYFADSLEYASSFRKPANLQDIYDVKMLSDSYFLVISETILGIFYFKGDGSLAVLKNNI